VVHLHSYKPQSGPLMMIKCSISVFHWNSVSIPNDRMVIEVHDYANSPRRYCLVANNHEIPKKFIFVS
jgi:hypothetical protein